MPSIVLTGATGFLGSHLMASLLEHGHRLIILGRSSDEGSLEFRITKLLQWFHLEDQKNQIETVEVNLLKPLCGLQPSVYQDICMRVGQIIHCASDTRFSERHRHELINTNVHSLKGIIALARDSRADFFHYVSTAYAVGAASSLCTETAAQAESFTNVYEETKAWAEKEVLAQCSIHSIPFSIIRPSIVYGDSQSGRASRFNALYNHVKSLYYIREIYLDDIKRNGGGKSAIHGIYLDRGDLHIPIRIALPQRGKINLIPIDYFVSATLAIMEHAENGRFYHVTTNTPSTMEELAAYCERFLEMTGLEVIYGDGEKSAPNPAGALFNKFIEPYRPYLSDLRMFDRSNTDRATVNQHPPQFTYEIFASCMEFAVGSGWQDLLISGRTGKRPCVTPSLPASTV